MPEEISVCPGCGLAFPSIGQAPDARLNASAACLELYGQLSGYTLTLGDPTFIHQHIVDAYGAQHAGTAVKPIRTAFSLIGLYLALEHHYTGKQVQQAHMLLARKSKVWPQFSPPKEKATVTVLDVVQSPDADKQAMIASWCQAVWATWKAEHQRVAQLAKTYLAPL